MNREQQLDMPARSARHCKSFIFSYTKSQNLIVNATNSRNQSCRPHSLSLFKQRTRSLSRTGTFRKTSASDVMAKGTDRRGMQALRRKATQPARRKHFSLSDRLPLHFRFRKPFRGPPSFVQPSFCISATLLLYGRAAKFSV